MVWKFRYDLQVFILPDIRPELVKWRVPNTGRDSVKDDRVLKSPIFFSSNFLNLKQVETPEIDIFIISIT